MPRPYGNPEYVPCPDCGVQVHYYSLGRHTCDPKRKLDFEMNKLESELSSFWKEFWRWRLSNKFDFEVYYAKRERLRAA